MAAEEGDFPDWAWSSFLNAEKRKTDKPRFMALIAERLARYLDNGKTKLVRPTANWLVDVSDCLSDQFPASFHQVMNTLIQTMAEKPKSGAAEIWQVDGARDWMTTAYYAPTGKLAQALFRAPQIYGVKINGDFPLEHLGYAGELLDLPSDLRRHALVIFTYRIQRFYETDREWSERNLLSILDSSDPDDRDAFWGGFLSNTQVSQELLMHLKPYLLHLARAGGETRREHSRGLSRIILAGWGSTIKGTSNRCISNEEFRDMLVRTDDEFRSHVLQQMTNLSCNKEKGTRDKWTSLLPEFLRDVWPRQRKANSPAVSASLCDLAFFKKELFPELVKIILPCLTKIEHHYLPLSEDVIKKYPHQTLDLLYVVLPDKVSDWPLDIEDIFFTPISENEPTLITNEKFLKLKRRWDSR